MLCLELLPALLGNQTAILGLEKESSGVFSPDATQL
jgi:hypothetical protein